VTSSVFAEFHQKLVFSFPLWQSGFHFAWHLVSDRVLGQGLVDLCYLTVWGSVKYDINHESSLNDTCKYWNCTLLSQVFVRNIRDDWGAKVHVVGDDEESNMPGMNLMCHEMPFKLPIVQPLWGQR
jgi:hypothetical protein